MPILWWSRGLMTTTGFLGSAEPNAGGVDDSQWTWQDLGPGGPTSTPIAWGRPI